MKLLLFLRDLYSTATLESTSYSGYLGKYKSNVTYRNDLWDYETAPGNIPMERGHPHAVRKQDIPVNNQAACHEIIPDNTCKTRIYIARTSGKI